MNYFITLITKYYWSNDIDAETLCHKIKEEILEFNIQSYQEYKYHNKIVKICNDVCCGNVEHSFKELDYIPIYENELNLVSSLKNDRQKKLLFTFFVIARYMNCNGWINKKDSKGISEVFKLANISLTSDKRYQLLHELYSNKYIFFCKKVDNLNIRVNLDDTGKIVYKVYDFNNIGNQYICNFKSGYKQCKQCGKKIKDTGNKKMYCSKCAIEKQLESDRKYQNKVRN